MADLVRCLPAPAILDRAKGSPQVSPEETHVFRAYIADYGSSRATVTTKGGGLFGQRTSVLSLCLVQLWTEVGDEDHNGEEWGTQQNAPPQSTSRLVIFVTEAKKSSFISIPREYLKKPPTPRSLLSLCSDRRE